MYGVGLQHGILWESHTSALPVIVILFWICLTDGDSIVDKYSVSSTSQPDTFFISRWFYSCTASQKSQLRLFNISHKFDAVMFSNWVIACTVEFSLSDRAYACGIAIFRWQKNKTKQNKTKPPKTFSIICQLNLHPSWFHVCLVNGRCTGSQYDILGWGMISVTLANKLISKLFKLTCHLACYLYIWIYDVIWKVSPHKMVGMVWVWFWKLVFCCWVKCFFVWTKQSCVYLWIISKEQMFSIQ